MKGNLYNLPGVLREEVFIKTKVYLLMNDIQACSLNLKKLKFKGYSTSWNGKIIGFLLKYKLIKDFKKKEIRYKLFTLTKKGEIILKELDFIVEETKKAENGDLKS